MGASGSIKTQARQERGIDQQINDCDEDSDKDQSQW